TRRRDAGSAGYDARAFLGVEPTRGRPTSSGADPIPDQNWSAACSDDAPYWAICTGRDCILGCSARASGCCARLSWKQL
ncbi:MAG: hypothetical protein ACPIOQ_78900, partial [Promethearchaeia archaeon]